MPIYEYKCSLCADDKVHVRVKAISEWNTEEHCDKCNTVLDKQVSTGTRAIFKSSGFYSVDYNSRTKQ